MNLKLSHCTMTSVTAPSLFPQCDKGRERRAERGHREASTAANGGLTHGAPVDGLGLVFVLGSVPHERQPFYSCQGTARDRQTERRTDREERATEQARGRWRERKQKKKGGAEQGDVVNISIERARGGMQREPSPWTPNWTTHTNTMQ